MGESHLGSAGVHASPEVPDWLNRVDRPLSVVMIFASVTTIAIALAWGVSNEGYLLLLIPGIAFFGLACYTVKEMFKSLTGVRHESSRGWSDSSKEAAASTQGTSSAQSQPRLGN